MILLIICYDVVACKQQLNLQLIHLLPGISKLGWLCDNLCYPLSARICEQVRKHSFLVSMERLQRVCHASRERLPLQTPGSVPFGGLHMLWLLRPVFRLYTDLVTVSNLTLTEFRNVIREHLRRVWHASRERLPFLTPGSVPPLGTCLCSDYWDQISRVCHVFFSTFHLEYPSVYFSVLH